MNFSTIVCLFILCVVLGVAILHLATKSNRETPWMIIFIILDVIASILSVPILASFSSDDFLNRTTRYMSGSSIDGYQFWFWATLIAYPLICYGIYYIITGKQIWN